MQSIVTYKTPTVSLYLVIAAGGVRSCCDAAKRKCDRSSSGETGSARHCAAHGAAQPQLQVSHGAPQRCAGEICTLTNLTHLNYSGANTGSGTDLCGLKAAACEAQIRLTG